MHQIRCKELFIKHLEALTSFPEEGNMLLQRKPKIFSPSGSTAFCVRTASYIHCNYVGKPAGAERVT